MSSFPSHVPRVVVGTEFLMAELALGNPRMLFAAGVASLHQYHYLMVKRRAIKNPSFGSDPSRLQQPRFLVMRRREM